MKQKTLWTIAVAAPLLLWQMAAQTPPPGPGGPPPQGAPGGRGGRGGGRAGGFTQFTRPVASADVLARGKSLYDANCASCHAVDMRGTDKGVNILRSGSTLDDKKGELVGKALAAHKPPVNFPQTDTVATAEYIHSVLATMGGQGSPPGRNPTGLNLNVLVGDANAGKAYFGAHCVACHSVTGDLKGLASKYEDDPRGLQSAWVAGNKAGGAFRANRGGGTGVGQATTVTMANGEKIQGTLVRKSDFLVVLTLADGTRRSIARNNGVPKVESVDPQAAHKKMAIELDDPDNKNMHDVTAYLATLK